jgi:hypothetical protein
MTSLKELKDIEREIKKRRVYLKGKKRTCFVEKSW